MAYLDQKPGTNQRATVMVAVALLQGATFLALVSGLTVKFIDRPPPPRIEGEQIRLEPLPVPPKPLVKPVPQLPKRPPLPVLQDPIFEGPVTDGPGPLPPFFQDSPPIPVADPLPQPPSFASHLARPRGIPGNWVTANDYPARELREGNQGTTRFELTIGADGKVQSCSITQSSGFGGLDDATCKHLFRRARFDAATDANGKPVTGEYSSAIRWVIPE